MREFGLTEDQLWQCAPKAAEAIFDYRASKPELTGFGFDSGGVIEAPPSAYANFSRVAISGLGRDELTIQAVQEGDTGFRVRHTIKTA